MRSVFTKLLVVIIITVVCINILVFGFFWAYRNVAGKSFKKNMAQYLNYLIEDMGTPPNSERAKQLALRSSIQIRYDGTDETWSTDEKLSIPHRLRWHEWRESPHIRTGIYRGTHLIEVDHGKGRFLFALGSSFDQETDRSGLVVILLSLLTLILIGAYLSIRWTLRPVKWLNEGVQQVSRGNLKHRVPVKRSDELKDLAEAFNAMTDRIREMLHAKEQLLLDVSHELRSPLTRMKVALEFLNESPAKQSIQTDVVEMEEMISEILETARLHHMHGQLKRRRVNLIKLVKEIIPMYENYGPGIHAGDLPSAIECNIDPDQVKAVLKNILNNAAKYSGPQSKPVKISVTSLKPHTIIRVEDNGIGIPEEELPYVFEPFYRVDKSRSKHTGGYGLGLSLCKTIMEAHGGKIEIESTLNKGTTISLFFQHVKRKGSSPN